MVRRHSSVGDFESAGIEPVPSIWKTVWKDNKGALYIVMAQMIGSSMDAMVRFLQQGGNRMHPFQVCEETPMVPKHPIFKIILLI